MKTDYPVAQLCLALGASRSGFYAWSNQRPCRRIQEDQRLTEQILTAHTRSRHTYGSPRIRIELQADGIGIGRRRIARIMRQQRIFGRSRKRRRPRTTHSDHDHPIAPNLLQDRAPAQSINEVWRTDITSVPTDEGWLSMSAMMDAYSRRIVGWACGSTLATGLCLDVLKRALQNRRPPAGSSITRIAAFSMRRANTGKRS
jgi:transposase InsO family protein